MIKTIETTNFLTVKRIQNKIKNPKETNYQKTIHDKHSPRVI